MKPNLLSSVRGLLPFLRPYPSLDQEQVEHILLVGAGSRLNIERALDSLALRFPAARLTLLARREDRRFGQAQLEQVVHYSGLTSAAQVRRALAATPFDVKVVLFTGEGQTILKWLAFLLPARRMLVFTEGGGTFSWSFDDRLAIWNHAKWRFGGGRPLIQTLLRLVRSLLIGVLSFAGFLLLLLWHARLLLQRLIWRRDRWPNR